MFSLITKTLYWPNTTKTNITVEFCQSSSLFKVKEGWIEMQELIQPKMYFCPYIFFVLEAKKTYYILVWQENSYIFLKDYALDTIFKEISRPLLLNIIADIFFRTLSSWLAPDLECVKTFM